MLPESVNQVTSSAHAVEEQVQQVNVTDMCQ